MNISFISYWMSGIAYIDVDDDNDTVKLEYVIFALMIIHSLWVFNFFIGFSFLRYEYLKGMYVYFTILMMLLTCRLGLNITLLDKSNIESILSSKFNVYIYVVGMVLESCFDWMLIWQNWKLYQSYRDRNNIMEKITGVSLQITISNQKQNDKSLEGVKRSSALLVSTASTAI